jgi:RNA polymerase sigma-54 factor
MRPELSTQLRLSQIQTLAPQLQQSLKLLQLPSLELQSMLAQQLSLNPTLEEYDPIRDSNDGNEAEQFNPDVQDITGQQEDREKSYAEEKYDSMNSSATVEENYEKQMSQITDEDDNWNNYYEASNQMQQYGVQTESVSYRESSPSRDEEYTFKINSIASRRNLRDDLREQYLSLDLSEEENDIFEYLIGSLDSCGFLEESVEEIAITTHKDINLIAQTLTLLKTFEPIGLGAKNLRECLMIQLEHKGDRDSLAYQVLDDYYQELLRNQFERIAQRLGISHDDLREAINHISTLDPRPGRDLNNEAAQHIRPDIIVTRQNDDTFLVETNDNILPYVRICPKMKNWVKHKAVDKPTLKYLREQIRDGEALINNIQFRKRTILAVAEAIVESQKDFFTEGTAHLQPLSMKEIADKVGVHEATVSRTVNQKYMDTPQGLYEMRYFFNAHVTDTDGNEISTNAVKAKLKEIIEKENKQKPYSDEKLAGILQEDGYPVARRTVVKYRKGLKIPNARQRKEFM